MISRRSFAYSAMIRRASSESEGLGLHPGSAKVAQDNGSRACACSMRHKRAYRPPYVSPWRALSPHELMRRKSNAGIWLLSDMIAPNAFNGKPLGFARLTRGPTGRHGCG